MARVSVSLPEKLVTIIDRQRGDIPRSRYIASLIKKDKDLDIGDEL